MCWHYSHSKGMHVKGVNLLSCIVQYGDVSLPIGYEIVHKDIKFSDIETRKVKRKASTTKNEHFRNLLNQAYINNVSFEWVLADSWFGSKENIEYINNTLMKKLIIGIKSNRTVALSEEDKKKGKFTKVSKLDLKDGQSIQVWIKGLDFALQLINSPYAPDDFLKLFSSKKAAWLAFSKSLNFRAKWLVAVCIFSSSNLQNATKEENI